MKRISFSRIITCRFPLTRRTAALLCATLAAAEVLGIGLVHVGQRVWLRARMYDTLASTFPGPKLLIYTGPSIERPPCRPASEAQLDDDEFVLGVTVDNSHRAYRIKAMHGRENHIINDIFEDVSISLTYCDITDCARAFTGSTKGRTLPIVPGGLCPEGMMIRIGDAAYSQSSLGPADPDVAVPPFPFAPFPIERMTWQDWRSQHPNTDVYEGDPPRLPGMRGE